jgi:tRNA uridine 5-carbamoylmethylation protein Kti12
MEQPTCIKITTETRNRVRSLKRGQETYDDLLDRMAEQYDPPEPGEAEP